MNLKIYGAHQAGPKIPVEMTDEIFLGSKTPDQLYEIRAEIDRRLNLGMHQLNVQEELTLNYHRASALVDRVNAEDSKTPANQRAQVFNSAKSLLAEIIKIRGLVYDAERLKMLEAAIVKSLSHENVSEEVRQDFFARYKMQLEKTGA